MFTGLVEEKGVIAGLERGADSVRLSFMAPHVRQGLEIGDSVSVNGCCLTVVVTGPDGFAVEAVAETLRRTTMGALEPGDEVNLERALVLGDRLGGHIVQGHVDGTGIVSDARPEGDSIVLRIGAAPDVLRYTVEKGSITIDGVSLTVAGVLEDSFLVALIPHTMAETTLGPDAVGRMVNLEVDVLAKYVERLIAPYRSPGDV
jgi:riboflavin synthase